jgi:Flp pilus assembly protein CpaB
MKQKNLILMVVAVGCGLVAAFLTSQMSARPKAAEAPMVEVLVASKELPTGTKFTKDSLKDQVKRKKIPQDQVPEGAVTNELELIDRQLQKTLKLDEDLRGGDTIETKYSMVPPQGKDLITVRLPIDKVTPFIKPGTRIDLIGTGVTRKQQVVGMMVLPDVLVMAVDIETRSSGDSAGRLNIQLTTLALSTEEALLVRMCETANIQLSYILRTEGDSDKRNPLDGWSKDKVRKWVENMQGDNESATPKSDGGQDRQIPAAAGQKVLLPVPTEDLPAGTEITFDLIKTKFKDVEFVAPAPENAVVKMDEFLGKYLLEKVSANNFVPKSYIGNKPEKKEGAKPAPKDDAKTDEPKRDTFDRSITNGNATKVYRFEKQDDGSWKMLGEVKEDGSVVPVPGNVPPPVAPPPAAPPAPGPEPKK